MAKKRDYKSNPARKNHPTEKSTLKEPPSMPVDGVTEKDKPMGLKPKYPDPRKGFTTLSSYLIELLTKLIMKYIELLLQRNGGKVNSAYWDSMTREMLGVKSRDQALVIPARAGAGKSTWIMAFILALCELFLTQNPLVYALGGVMIVLQKVETLNDILDTIEHFFPGHSEIVMVALQGWSKSGQEHGFCQNKHISKYSDCLKDQCPYAVTCKVRSFQDKAESKFIVGMTQARFSMLRSSDELDQFLFRSVAEHELPIPRRFLIFDEKFDMAQQSTLSVPLINEASTEIERIARSLNLPDSETRKIQNQLTYLFLAPFQKLRKSNELETTWSNTDIPFGFCSLDDEELKQSLIKFAKSFEGNRKGLMTLEIQNCISVMKKLFEELCLFVKSGGFRVVSTKPREVLFGAAQTIIFDATAEVDGDYLYLDQARFLPSSPALHMDKVTFHIFQHPDLNVSKSAMKKPWKLPSFKTLIETLIDKWEGDTFLCTYKEYAEFLPEQFSEATDSRIPKMTNKDHPCLPYFGGTNGANNFNHCINVIMLGYPRLSPADYLLKAFAAWGAHGFTQEILNLSGIMEYQEQIRKDAFRDLPMLIKYESMHLAARLEQEIYRCALRNAVCEHDINIALFSPSKQLLKILLDRFDGCSVEYYDTLPDCVAFNRDSSRTYGGNPTTYSKLAAFLMEWDGDPIKSSELRKQLDISEHAWKDLMKAERTKQLLSDHGVSRTGRGPNTTFLRQDKLCA